MNLKRYIYPWAFLALLGITGLAAFKFYYKTVPFYLRLKNRRKRSIYQLRNGRLDGSSFLADLIKRENFHIFTLKINFVNDEIIRIQITDPNYKRYAVQDVILEPLILEDNKLNLQQVDHILRISSRRFTIQINCEDFEILFYENDSLFVSFNKQKTFIIEEKEPHVAIAVDFVINNCSKIYGLPQHADNLTLSSIENKPYRLYNVDRFAYSSTDPHQSLYGSVPLIYAINPCKTIGILWLNSSETFLDLIYGQNHTQTRFFSESGTVEFYILTGPKLSDCVRQNGRLTGVTPLPPLFSLGYHQCRFSYMTQKEVMEVSNNFDRSDFPLDSLWMDVDYTDDKKYFTWDPETYPDPEALLKYLESKKRKGITILDPHIKVDDDYFVYTHCKNQEFFIKMPKNGDFIAKCWPGLSCWIDFCNPKAREFYANLHIDFAKFENLHIWNDMNEPALFDTEENSMPKNLLHHGGWKHRDVHNLYGFYQTMATYDGLLKRDNVRPFILTRSHFVGSQRYAAIWTGDNVATWSHLKISIPMCLTASLTGFSLCGADVGGFVKHPNEELLQRWYQLGAWLPFFRGHSNRNVPRREPYLYDMEVQQRIRNALQQRYKHLLYWYTVFWQHYKTAEPVIKPLIYQYPEDEQLEDFDTGFLIGRDILLHPVVDSEINKMDVYLPGGAHELWYQLEDSQIRKYKGNGTIDIFVDINTIPVFYRGGSIIPILKNPLKSSAFAYESPVDLYIFCDNQGNATGTLYYDDMESFDYLKNIYNYIEFTLKDSTISNVCITSNARYDQSIILSSINLYGYQMDVRDVQLRLLDEERIINLTEIEKKENFIKICKINIDIKTEFNISLKMD